MRVSHRMCEGKVERYLKGERFLKTHKLLFAFCFLSVCMATTGCGTKPQVEKKGDSAWDSPMTDSKDTASAVDELMREWDKEQRDAMEHVDKIYEQGGVDVSDDYVMDERPTASPAASKDATDIPAVTPVPVKLDSSTVFIGDSVMQGVDNYDVFPDAQFLTKIGLNIYSLLHDKNFMSSSGQVTAMEALQEMKAETVFIMIGSNEIEWMAQEDILRYDREFITQLREYKKDIQIFFMSVPPIRHQYEVSVPDVTQKKIDGFNVELEKLCDSEQVSFINISEKLKGKDGYLKKKYSELDGMHWRELGCQAFCKYIKEYLHIE